MSQADPNPNQARHLSAFLRLLTEQLEMECNFLPEAAEARAA